jgi:hypothetical protein
LSKSSGNAIGRFFKTKHPFDVISISVRSSCQRKYIQQEMKFTQQELEAAPGAPPAPRIDATTTLSNASRARSACVIDFFDARDRLRAGSEECSKEVEINRKASKAAAHRLPSADRVDRLEELLYSLLSAATLVYLLLCIIA